MADYKTTKTIDQIIYNDQVVTDINFSNLSSDIEESINSSIPNQLQPLDDKIAQLSGAIDENTQHIDVVEGAAITRTDLEAEVEDKLTRKIEVFELLLSDKLSAVNINGFPTKDIEFNNDFVVNQNIIDKSVSIGLNSSGNIINQLSIAIQNKNNDAPTNQEFFSLSTDMVEAFDEVADVTAALNEKINGLSTAIESFSESGQPGESFSDKLKLNELSIGNIVHSHYEVSEDIDDGEDSITTEYGKISFLSNYFYLKDENTNREELIGNVISSIVSSVISNGGWNSGSSPGGGSGGGESGGDTASALSVYLENDPTDIYQFNYTFSAEGGDDVFYIVQGNTDWQISSNSEFLHVFVDPQSTEIETEPLPVSLTVDQNNTSDQRLMIITISIGYPVVTSTKQIYVYQEAASGGSSGGGTIPSDVAQTIATLEEEIIKIKEDLYNKVPVEDDVQQDSQSSDDQGDSSDDMPDDDQTDDGDDQSDDSSDSSSSDSDESESETIYAYGEAKTDTNKALIDELSAKVDPSYQQVVDLVFQRFTDEDTIAQSVELSNVVMYQELTAVIDDISAKIDAVNQNFNVDQLSSELERHDQKINDNAQGISNLEQSIADKTNELSTDIDLITASLTGDINTLNSSVNDINTRIIDIENILGTQEGESPLVNIYNQVLSAKSDIVALSSVVSSIYNRIQNFGNEVLSMENSHAYELSVLSKENKNLDNRLLLLEQMNTLVIEELMRNNPDFEIDTTPYHSIVYFVPKYSMNSNSEEQIQYASYAFKSGEPIINAVPEDPPDMTSDAYFPYNPSNGNPELLYGPLRNTARAFSKWQYTGITDNGELIENIESLPSVMPNYTIIAHAVYEDMIAIVY